MSAIFMIALMDISIHAPHARSDACVAAADISADISIHAPHARSDRQANCWNVPTCLFQSTLLMRGATRPCRENRGADMNFNPRSSCEERPAAEAADIAGTIFQSTLLMRGATPSTNLVRTEPKFQSTLLMRGATTSYWPASRPVTISIHAPHARSDDRTDTPAPSRGADFNPRSSCEERLACDGYRAFGKVISIHAPHARSDWLLR